MERNRAKKNGVCGVGDQESSDRPLSRARKTTSGGIRSPETAFLALLDCAADVLGGSVTPAEANAVARVVTGAVTVSKNGDLLDAMLKRIREAKNANSDDEADLEAEKIAEMELELLKLKQARLRK